MVRRENIQRKKWDRIINNSFKCNLETNLRRCNLSLSPFMVPGVTHWVVQLFICLCRQEIDLLVLNLLTLNTFCPSIFFPIEFKREQVRYTHSQEWSCMASHCIFVVKVTFTHTWLWQLAFMEFLRSPITYHPPTCVSISNCEPLLFSNVGERPYVLGVVDFWCHLSPWSLITSDWISVSVVSASCLQCLHSQIILQYSS